jgi:hypothetical protein
MVPDVITPPGIQEIKWIELYDQFRPMIPAPFNEQWYFGNPPPQEVRDRVKGQKRKAKVARGPGRSRQRVDVGDGDK